MTALQGTEQWRAVRCGKLTASRLADALAKTKTGWSASRATYMGQLLTERLTGQPIDQHVTPAMRWGTLCEDHARAAYSFYTDRDVMLAGFVDHPRICMSGASPDGYVEGDGLIEVKCPNTTTHIDNLLGSECPPRYLFQIQWQLACAARKWCDLVSFDPRLPESLRFAVYRVHRNDEMIKMLEEQAEAFLSEIEVQARSVFARRREARA